MQCNNSVHGSLPVLDKFLMGQRVQVNLHESGLKCSVLIDGKEISVIWWSWVQVFQ